MTHDSTCPGCEEPIDGGDVVPIDGEHWHARCAMLHVIGSIAELAPRRRKLLTARQVGELLGESADSVARRKEEIGYVRLRREGVPEERSPIRFRQEDVDRYIDANFEPPVDGDEQLSRVRRQPRPAVVDRNPHLLPRRLRDRSA